jgi:hypothetical protein
MTRLLWYALVLAVAAAALVALPADGYQFFSQEVPGVAGVLPSRWQALPVDMVVDSAPAPLLPEIEDAIATWNAVSTARAPFGTASLATVDFNKDNLGTAWGNLTGDGRQEVVFDQDGQALTALGFAPDAVNGFGAKHEVIAGGKAAIDDMFLIISGTHADFDRRATEVHELGHTLGLAHSSVGFSLFKDGALEPPLASQVPTMHPFNEGGTERRSLEADDRAALSELYPGPAFSTTDGTISGSVLRCDTGGAVSGANVRAININDPSVQLTRVTGFDGTTGGQYEIKGVPPGTYRIVVEPLSGDNEFADRLALFTDVDTDFTQEYFNADKEDDCGQDSDLTASTGVVVAGGGRQVANFKVTKATLALVVDVTGSMGPEIGAIKTGLETMISGLQAVPGDFPETAIVTFDDHATINTVSHDPSKLREVIAGFSTHGTPDCPEGSNAALMTAGRLLGSGGRAILITDANSHPTGPSRASVDALYAEKGARISTLLSGSCPPDQSAPKARALAAGGGPAGPDTGRPADALGKEDAVRTFSEESLFSGGAFSFQPEIKLASAPEAKTRYANTIANLGISAVRPAVAALEPAAAPRAGALDVELTGSNTGFAGASTLEVAGGGVSVSDVHVLSPTRLTARLTIDAGAATGFRDVTVTTTRGDGSTETATGIGALQVTASGGPAILSVSPGSGARGTTEDVRISGGSTHFAASTASFGPGVTVNSLTVQSPTVAVANVTVAAGADITFRDVTVSSGAETATGAHRFLVTPPAPQVARLTGASPRSGARGTTVDVQLAGASTAFAGGISVASVSGTGVEVLSTSVTSATSATARLRIAAGAPLGFRDLKVTTGPVVAVLLDGFEITPAAQPAATPVATPSATPAPAPPAPACLDRTPPVARFSSARVKKHRLQLRGRASDAGCGGAVARVEVAISRKAGRKCRFIGAAGKRSCSKPAFLRAKGTATWSLAVKLPRGSYTLQLRARDRAGNVQRAVTKRVRA